jgi:putative transposase
MARECDSRGRHSPYLHENRALFITFATYQRWELPFAARDLALEACTHVNGTKCSLHAAVIMPDHARLVLTPHPDEEGPFALSSILRGIKGESGHRINQALGRRGSVWQDQAFDCVFQSKKSLEQKILHIVQDPVRAGLVKTRDQYRWLWLHPSFLSPMATQFESWASLPAPSPLLFSSTLSSIVGLDLEQGKCSPGPFFRTTEVREGHLIAQGRLLGERDR